MPRGTRSFRDCWHAQTQVAGRRLYRRTAHSSFTTSLFLHCQVAFASARQDSFICISGWKVESLIVSIAVCTLRDSRHQTIFSASHEMTIYAACAWYTFELGPVPSLISLFMVISFDCTVQRTPNSSLNQARIHIVPLINAY